MRRGAWALALALGGLAAGCGGGQVAPEARPSAPSRQVADELVETPFGRGVWHEVIRGQTLWRIARAYGTSVETLARANRLDDPTDIAGGSRLFVPGAVEVIDVAPASSLVGGDTPAGVSFEPGETDYFTFLPDFIPRPLMPPFLALERRLEESRLQR